MLYSHVHACFIFLSSFIDDLISYPLVKTPQPSHRDHSILHDDDDDYPGNNRIATPLLITEMDDGGQETSLVGRDISTPDGTEMDDSDTLLEEQVDFIP